MVDAIRAFRKDIGPVELLSKSLERELLTKAKDGDKAARDAIVVAFAPLVIGLTRGMTRRGMPKEDLLQHGLIGLMTAVSKFDLAQDVRFQTYARYRIRQAMQRAAHGASYTVAYAIPIHVWECYEFLRRYEAQSSREEAEKLWIKSCPKSWGPKLRASSVKSTRLIGSGTFSHSTDMDRISDQRERALCVDDRERIDLAVQRLPENWRRVINGLYLDSPAKTSQELGDELGVTYQRIHQIRNKAFTKLRLYLSEAECSTPAASQATKSNSATAVVSFSSRSKSVPKARPVSTYPSISPRTSA